ncbi:MAG: hypothetical protein OES79_16180 [Planctomycetota bacterium]|nr:hypothetical protein [Planctomycetota bacterium]
MALSVLLGGCATIVRGTDQMVQIDSKPPGAACELMNREKIVASVLETPQSVTVPKSRHPLEIRCRKVGIGNAVAVMPSQIDLTTTGNLIAGGIPGLVIDGVSGAMNRYPANFLVTFPGHHDPEPKADPKDDDDKKRPIQPVS